MELNKEQIQLVNNYVEQNMNYIDLKLEVLDHMVLDIEQLINKHNYSFENAYKSTLLKWNKSFRKTSNAFYFSNFYSAPKMVLSKAIKNFKWYFFTYLLFYFSIALSTKYFTFSINENSILFLNTVIKYLVIISLAAFIYLQTIIHFSKIKSTFGFIIKNHVFHGVFLLIPLLTNDYFKPNKSTLNLSLAWALIGIYIVIILFIFYKKHLKIVSKFSLE